MTNELSINELDTVSAGVGIGEACGVATAIGAAMSTIAGINNVLTAAVDGIPPQSCHTPNNRPA
jgi:hypothetical protein